MKVMSEVEVTARQEIELESYIMHLQIEGRVFNELVYGHIVPAALAYQNKLLKTVMGLKDIYGDSYKTMAAAQLTIIEEIATYVNTIKSKVDEMTQARRDANNLKDLTKKAFAYCDNVKPYFEEIRYNSDKLEQLIENELWPLTKYRELLFTE